jgi:hypothetical protein
VALVPSVATRYANRRVRFLPLSSPRPAGRIGIAFAARADDADRQVERFLGAALEAVGG